MPGNFFYDREPGYIGVCQTFNVCWPAWKCLLRYAIERADGPAESEITSMGKNRLEAFSEGVIALIITIMVLELKVPQGGDVLVLIPL
jgi:hypothetical protein